MKNTIIIFFLIVTIVACKNETYKIKGTLAGSRGQKIVLKELTLHDAIIIDSTSTGVDGNYILQGKVVKPGFYMLSLSNENYITLLINPGDKIELNADVANLLKSYTVSGSKDAIVVRQLDSALNSATLKIEALRKLYQDSIHSREILKIRKQVDSAYQEITFDHHKYTCQFIKRNLNSMASLLALYQQYDARHSVMRPNVDYYFFHMVDSSMIINFAEADATQSLHTLMSDISEQKIRAQETEQRMAIGAVAPEIALPSQTGDTIRLTSIRGKYVLVDFSASWNTSSINFNNNLVQVYWNYRKRGFEIFQVSLDKNKEAWINNIQQHGLRWIQVSDLKMWESPVVALYGFQTLPFNVLLDRNGVIIAKNLSAEELNQRLKELFKY